MNREFYFLFKFRVMKSSSSLLPRSMPARREVNAFFRASFASVWAEATKVFSLSIGTKTVESVALKGLPRDLSVALTLSGRAAMLEGLSPGPPGNMEN